ncbi:MAG TPA: folate family ECF transporter S component [Clostridiales bacterium]|nr:folate family ECF transporter S component [Clostridiales bacterium]
MKKTYFTSKRIAYIAIFAAMSVALKVFSIDISIANKLSLMTTMNVLAGIFTGPIGGFIVGVLADGLGFLIKPSGGAWMPLITLVSGLSGLIPGLVFKIKKIHPIVRIIISIVLVYFVCTVFLNSLIIYYFFIQNKTTFFVWLLTRIPLQSGVYLVNSILIIILYKILEPRIKLDSIENKIKTTIENKAETNEAASN